MRSLEEKEEKREVNILIIFIISMLGRVEMRRSDLDFGPLLVLFFFLLVLLFYFLLNYIHVFLQRK